jgi:hypothetical protein
MRPAIVLLLLLAAACSTAKWDKPGATDEQIQADGKECWDKAYDMARSTASPAPNGVIVGGPTSTQRDRAMDETALFQRCMRDKGYAEKK